MSPRWSLALAAAAALSALAFVGWLQRTPVVPAVNVQWAPLVHTLQFSGRAATASRVDVGSTLTGRVAQIAVREGERVNRGATLVTLEDDEWQAALAQARAGELQAAARLAGLRSSGRGGAAAAVAQAESVLLAARADLQRTQDLVARGFVSAARLDESQRAVDVARAQLDAAQAQRAANADQGTDVAQAQAQLALAAAATAAARARLAQSVLVAPADARVLLRAVEPGQIVQPGKALLSLALDGPLQLVAQVDERSLQQLRPGQSARVLTDAYPDQAFAAQVLSIAPLVDAQRGAVEVKLALVAPLPAFLREDMTVSVAVTTARRERALVVPAAALRGDTGSDVWLAIDGRVVERQLRLGLRTLDAAEVLGGLAAGDTVLVGSAPAPGRRVAADTRLPLPALRPAGEDAGAALTNAMGR